MIHDHIFMDTYTDQYLFKLFDSCYFSFGIEFKNISFSMDKASLIPTMQIKSQSNPIELRMIIDDDIL